MSGGLLFSSIEYSNEILFILVLNAPLVKSLNFFASHAHLSFPAQA